MIESVIRNLTRVFTIALLIALLSAVCAADVQKPEEFTIRYILFTAGPVQYGYADTGNQFILPLDGTGLVLDQDPVHFLKKISMVWPQYNYTPIASGSIVFTNNAVCEENIVPKPDDPRQLSTVIRIKPRINRSDRSVTMHLDTKFSYINGTITIPDDPSKTVPITVTQEFVTSRRLVMGRTYPVSGVETNHAAFTDDPFMNMVLVFAVCVLPGRM